MVSGAILVLGVHAHAGVPAVQDSTVQRSVPRTLAVPWLASEMAQTWICDRSDSVCGLDDPKMLSKPAKFDYDAVLKATPEMKKITADKIDPNSSEGINLKNKAMDRVREKAESVRVAQGYCSVWKTISHKDGRTIPDITDLVKAQL
jgi:hypothetical protein